MSCTPSTCNPVEFPLDYRGEAPVAGNIATYVQEQITLALNEAFTSADYSLAAAGTVTVEPALNAKSHVALVTALSSGVAVTSTVILSHTNATNGKRVVVRVFLPATSDVTVNIRTASVIGPLLHTVQSLGAPAYPSGRYANAEFVYSASTGQWELVGFSDTLIDAGS